MPFSRGLAMLPLNLIQIGAPYTCSRPRLPFKILAVGLNLQICILVPAVLGLLLTASCRFNDLDERNRSKNEDVNSRQDQKLELNSSAKSTPTPATTVPKPKPTPLVVGTSQPGISYPSCANGGDPTGKTCRQVGGPFQELVYCESNGQILAYRCCYDLITHGQTFQPDCKMPLCSEISGSACDQNISNQLMCIPDSTAKFAGGPWSNGPLDNPGGYADYQCVCSSPDGNSNCTWKPIPPGKPGDKCGDDADCAAPSKCQPSEGAGGVCRIPAPRCIEVGTTYVCGTSMHCCEGSCKPNGKGYGNCVLTPDASKPPGEACAADTECAYGPCVNRVCSASLVSCIHRGGDGHGDYPPGCCTYKAVPDKGHPCCNGSVLDPNTWRCEMAPTPVPAASTR